MSVFSAVPWDIDRGATLECLRERKEDHDAQMPNRAGSESEGEELIFLSPEEDPPEHTDQGASPLLRRSTRKRKSVSDAKDMSKTSASKKKKGASPPKEGDPGRSMPRIPRTPQGQQQEHEQGCPAQPPPRVTERERPMDNDIERLLLAMEGRIMTKLDATNRAVSDAVSLSKQTNEALATLEEKVDKNEEAFKAAIVQSEEKVTAHMDGKVGDLVAGHLRSMGFDPDLTAGALSLRDTLVQDRSQSDKEKEKEKSWAAVASSAKSNEQRKSVQQERREEKFWECRRSLRIWPLPGASKDSLDDFLLEKLGLDGNFVLHELGETTIRPHRDPRSKFKDEAYVTFETKEVRDAVKARASYLANFRDDQAGMRLHLPNYLQRDFRSLMGLAYELKKKHPELKRNVKFDEEDLGLFMDMQLEKRGHWRRVKPDEAKLAHTSTRTGPERLAADELMDMLGGTEGSGVE